MINGKKAIDDPTATEMRVRFNNLIMLIRKNIELVETQNHGRTVTITTA